MVAAGQRSSGAAGQWAPRQSGDRSAGSAPPPRRPAAPLPHCQRCNFPVPLRPVGCKNPCPNCGTIYPLGDCSD